jgi:hypothetical protein
MFHNLYQQLFISLRGRESPISYVQKIIKKTPDSRFDIRFQSQFEDYKRIKHLLGLNNQERIMLDMLSQGDNYEKMVNELPHLFLIVKIENSRGYLLKDFREINPPHHKMGDIYVPSKGQKYESKSYEKLAKFKVREIIKQYESNKLSVNNVKFSIFFQDVVSGSSIESFRELHYAMVKRYGDWKYPSFKF